MQAITVHTYVLTKWYAMRMDISTDLLGGCAKNCRRRRQACQAGSCMLIAFGYEAEDRYDADIESKNNDLQDALRNKSTVWAHNVVCILTTYYEHMYY